jgi:catechol 2,3-dioxygenase-like lactoylglutathione lyase family enzyme
VLERLDHLLVLTDDLEASRAFYCDALGFTAGERPPFEFAGHWLYLDGGPCLHLADRAEYEAHIATRGLRQAAGPIDHVALAATGYDELAARLEAAGVDAVRNEVPGVFRQLFVTDPNGVRIELNVAQVRE